jgi:hypothetical protein
LIRGLRAGITAFQFIVRSKLLLFDEVIFVKSKWSQFFAVGIMIASLGMNAFAGPDLGGVMKNMATDFAQIQQQVSDSSQNASTESLCDSLNATIDQAKTITPNKILAMPSDQQPAQMQAYVQMLSQLEGLVLQMKGDLLNGDNTSAAAMIAQINALKAKGHTAFR